MTYIALPKLDLWCRVRQHASSPFNPTSLFTGGQTGGWWDASDMTTLWQDSGRTTPATAAGQAIGAIDDKSGNGNHLLQATAAQKPILRNSGALWWLEFNAGATAQNIGATFTFNQPASRVSGMQQTSYNVTGQVIFCDAAGGNLRLIQAGASPDVFMFSGSFSNETLAQWQLNTAVAVTEFWSGASSTIAINNGADITGNPGANNGTGFFIGAVPTGLSPTGVIYYSGLAIGRALTASEVASCRTFFGAKAGLTL